jgi:hypothetical protein
VAWYGPNEPARSPPRCRRITALEAELQAIQDAAPLPANDLTLIDELPYAPGLLAHAPDDLRERLAAAFTLTVIYRPDQGQATVILTLTDTTPATVNAIMADPRIGHHTTAGTVRDTPVDVPRTALAK